MLGRHNLPYRKKEDVRVKELPAYVTAMFRAIMDYFDSIKSEIDSNSGGSCLEFDSLPTLTEGMRGRGLLIKGVPGSTADTCFDVHHDSAGALTTTQRY